MSNKSTMTELEYRLYKKQLKHIEEGYDLLKNNLYLNIEALLNLFENKTVKINEDDTVPMVFAAPNDYGEYEEHKIESIFLQECHRETETTHETITIPLIKDTDGNIWNIWETGRTLFEFIENIIWAMDESFNNQK